MKILSRADARTPVYFLPIWFQAIDGNSAVESGIHLLPMVLSLVVASILTGLLTTRIGFYMPFLILGICVTAVGAGLLTTLSINTLVGQWIGYHILYGYGLGSSFQAPNMAAQTVLPRNEVSIGASLMLFAQTLFGAIFVSVGQNVLNNQLAKRLAGIPGISPRLIQSTGATELLKLIPTEYYGAALEAYNDSLRVCFQVGLIMACLSILGALGMECRSVKNNLPAKNPDDERPAEEGKGQSNLSQKEAPETEADAEAVAVTVADGEKDNNAAAAVLTVSTEATRTAS
jgi:MFS family permease